MSRKKRRKFSKDFKLDTVMEGLRGEKSIAQICRERDITDSLYYKWRDIFIEHAEEIFEDRRENQKEENEDRTAELERMVGRLTMENDILKKAKSWLGTVARRNER
jgi:transposase-like protein